MRILLATVLIAASGAARAQLSPPPPPPPEPAASAPAIATPTPTPVATPTAAPAPAEIGPRLPMLGLETVAGTPAGAVLALTFRPYTSYLRLHGGVTWNYFAFGLQGGLTVIPFRLGVTPTATVEIGTVFDSDLRSPLSGLAIPTALKGSLTSAGYSYVSGKLGLEVGNPDGLVFLVRAGITRTWSTLDGANGYQTGSGTITTSPLHLSTTSYPTVDVGLAFHLW